MVGKAIEKITESNESENELLGSLIGGSIDYVATKTVGKIFENDGSENESMPYTQHYPVHEDTHYH